MRSRIKLATYSCIISCFTLFFEPGWSINAIQDFTLTSSELQSLQNPTSQTVINPDELSKWDKVSNELLLRFPLGNGESTRLAAYLYEAQRAFAEASHKISGKYSGSFDPISIYVLKLFFPNYTQQPSDQDPFSRELSGILGEKISERFNAEQRDIHPIAYVESKDSWHGKVPFVGISIPSMKTWKIELSKFIAPPPPPPEDTKFWLNQLAQVKKAMESASESQKQEILYWAGLEKPGSGDWIIIANEYLSDTKTPLEKQLEVRAALAKAQLDIYAAMFASKYKYMVRRPNMLDPELKTYIQTPNHPSYPAGHSCCSACAAEILSFYFPERAREWKAMAEGCGMSRIRAGLHFPIDHANGAELGVKVGQQYTRKTAVQNQ